MLLTPNTLLQSGRYRIIDTLGRGGFGITYLAEQVMARRKVCIKEYFPEDYYRRDSATGALSLSSEGFVETMNRYKAKFIKEAQTIAALDHANIIHIYDIFEENNTAYCVMEYVEGESLSGLNIYLSNIPPNLNDLGCSCTIYVPRKSIKAYKEICEYDCDWGKYKDQIVGYDFD